jgi:hypothetical protein
MYITSKHGILKRRKTDEGSHKNKGNNSQSKREKEKVEYECTDTGTDFR